MKDCKNYERLFEKALYDELTHTEEKIFMEHINSCSSCRLKFQELKETLTELKKYQRPEPDEDFMNSFWGTLQPKLAVNGNTQKNPWAKLIYFFRSDFKWKYQLAGGIAILVIGLFIGKYFLAERGDNNQAVTSNKNELAVSEAKADLDAAKYIERSKILLLGIVNFDPSKDDAETINLSHIKNISKQLASEAPALKADLNEPSQQQLKRLVSNLQLILLQIANLEEKNNLDGIELIKEGVNSQNIFLKINIQQLQEGNKSNNKQNSKSGKENKNI
jgi:hypothetical protein